MDITMVKYVFVSQKRAIKSDRKKYALRSRSSQTQNVYFFFCVFGGEVYRSTCFIVIVPAGNQNI